MPKPTHLMVTALKSRTHEMSNWESDFIKSIADVPPGKLSGRQIVKVYDIYNKYCGGK